MLIHIHPHVFFQVEECGARALFVRRLEFLKYGFFHPVQSVRHQGMERKAEVVGAPKQSHQVSIQLLWTRLDNTRPEVDGHIRPFNRVL